MDNHDINLTEKLRRGERDAAIECIEIHYEKVFGFLRRLAGNDADAGDLTQRTFARVWQALPSFAGRSSISSWIHGIAYHVYVDWRRGNHRTEYRSDAWWGDQISNQLSPAELATNNDLRVNVYASVDALPPDLRETIHLHYYQGLTLQETAEAMGVASSTVKYRLRQALQALETDLRAGANDVRLGRLA